MEVLTVKDLAQKLRIGINTAYKLVRSGEIRSVRVGRQFRIPSTEIERYLKQRQGDCA